MKDEGTCPGALFSQPWWLNAVADGRWGEVAVEKGGKIVARMPYVWSERRSKSLVMPKLTQTLGPWMDLGTGKLATRLSRCKDLSQELIDRLPRFARFRQNFHYSISYWLPWYWNGFTQTTLYTYVLSLQDAREHLWSGLSSNVKGDIRKAQKLVGVEILDSPDAFFELNRLVFFRQGITVPYTRDFVERLDNACWQRGQRRIFLARGADGKPHAGCYIVWDEESAYYLMGGSDPELRSSGATSLCLWEAIQFAATVTRRFDFEGSMIEPVERFFRGFGGTPMPYYAISKSEPSITSTLKQAVIKRWKRRLG